MAGGYSLQNHSVLRQYLAEMLGTFILMVFGLGSIAQTVLSRHDDGSNQSIHWAWGISVALGISASVGVSGGHLNPAVSVAMATVGRLPWVRVPVFMLAQYVASFLAALVVYLTYMDALDNYDGGNRQTEGENATAGIFATYPQPYVSIWTAVWDQILGTGLMMLSVMALVDQRHCPCSPPSITPFFIGGVVIVIGLAFGLNCGYPINPARDLSPRIFTALAGWGIEPFSFRQYDWFWVPVVGPHIGAVLGAHLYQLMVGMHWPPLAPPSQVVCNKKAETLELSLNTSGRKDVLCHTETADTGNLEPDTGNVEPDTGNVEPEPEVVTAPPPL